MPGFQTISQIITANSSGKGQANFWQKTSPTVVANSFSSLWRVAGIPGAGADPSSLAATVCGSSTVGALKFTNPTSPATLHLLNVWASSATAGATGTLMLVDRLLAYGNINLNSASAQNLTNTATLPRYTTGDGVEAFLEVTTAPGATAANATLTYTNEVGTTGRSTGANALVVSSVANRMPHSFPFFPIQAGDYGVRSVQTITLSAAMLSGVANLVLCKPLGFIPLTLLGVAGKTDFVFDIPNLPQIQNGACLQWIFIAPNASTTPLFMGGMQVAEN